MACMFPKKLFAAGVVPAAICLASFLAAEPAAGPLRVHPENPRYFTDGSGRPVYLTGSHTWNNLVDMGTQDPPRSFDFNKYLDRLESYGHNFIRLWTWESVTWDTRANGGRVVLHVAPQPWARTGPGKALDGKPKFDLEKFNREYFRRLHDRVAAAGKRGVYVSVMLFEGWALQFSPGAWKGHPFHRDNNLNGVDGDGNGDGKGLEIHTLASKEITKLQEAYVRKVVDTVSGLDNVLYEISNENHPPSTEWQYHMIRFIKKYEKGKAKQHPVGMTFQYRGGTNETLLRSPADWISPNPKGGYRDNPPAADGRKVILSDTDHLWGIGGNVEWVWKTFLRGGNPLFMDPYEGKVLAEKPGLKSEAIRRALGFTRRYALKMDLAAARPRGGVSTTGYCLVHPGVEYLVYLPSGGKPAFTVEIDAASYRLEWFDPGRGKVVKTGRLKWAGGRRKFQSPLPSGAVLYLRSASGR